MQTANPQTTKLQIAGMHCTSCAMNIDFELEDLEGVTEAKTHYAKQVSVVTFDPSKVNHQKLLAVIAELGYEALVTQ